MDGYRKGMSKIFIVNGISGSGKDKFVELLKKHSDNIYKTSIIDPIKQMLDIVCLDEEEKRSDDYRRLLSNVKILVENYNHYLFINLHRQISVNSDKIIFIDMRSPYDIQKAIEIYGAKTIFVENDRINHIPNNDADRAVFDIDYDYTVSNNGTLEDLEQEAIEFLELIGEWRD